jgi:hypothetical protein
MPKSTVSVNHSLGQERAIELLKRFLPRIRDKFQGQVSDLEESWTDNVLNFSFKTFGFKIEGKMDVAEDSVKLEQNLPLAAMMFKGKVEEAIRTELGKLLA